MGTYIFSGGPGCGKSSVLLHLELVHHCFVVHESAESIIRVEQARGCKLPWARPGFQRKICELQAKRLQSIPNLDCDVFLDRYYVDAIVYAEAMGVLDEIPDEIENAIDSRIPVFFFEPLERHEQNHYRREDVAESRDIHKRIRAAYTNRKFRIVRVLPDTLESRSAFVLQEITRLQSSY